MSHSCILHWALPREAENCVAPDYAPWVADDGIYKPTASSWDNSEAPCLFSIRLVVSSTVPNWGAASSSLYSCLPHFLTSVSAKSSPQSAFQVYITLSLSLFLKNRIYDRCADSFSDGSGGCVWFWLLLKTWANKFSPLNSRVQHTGQFHSFSALSHSVISGWSF